MRGVAGDAAAVPATDLGEPGTTSGAATLVAGDAEVTDFND